MPDRMRACVAAVGGAVRVEDRPIPSLQVGQVLVRISAAALNRRDLYISTGEYPDLRLPCILGSDGCGVVTRVSRGEDERWLGERVIVNPGFGFEPTKPFRDNRVLGMPDDGTLAEYIAVGVDRLARAPKHLSDAEAAALPLAGLTAYRAVRTMGDVSSASRVLVTGVGGGVALFALQFARALGARVFVTSGDETKIRRAVDLGASGGISYWQDKWQARIKRLAGEFDVVIDGAGGAQFGTLLSVLRPCGTLVCYGKTLGDAELPLFKLMSNTLTIKGVVLGTDDELDAMLALVEQARIVPAIDAQFSMHELERAFARLKRSEQFGKIVIQMAE